jgi:DNA-binding MarR family transcriptional regulator
MPIYRNLLMSLRGLSSRQEQIVLYLYEFKNTPERGVGPDPRLTMQGITEGTQIPSEEAKKQLQRLVEKALVRSVLIGRNVFYYLTIKGYQHVEKVQCKSFNIGLKSGGFGVGFSKSETQGADAFSNGERKK